MYLYIDTSKDKTIVKLFKQDFDEIDGAEKDGMKNQSENLLCLIDKILEDNSKTKKEIRAIFVFVGPGSYTGLRVGVATANSLVYSLGVQVIGVEGEPTINDLENNDTNKFARPKYSYPPKITKEKPRL